MNLRDYQRLEYIFDHCCSIEETLERCNRSYDTFAADSVFQSALAFDILQIGELASKLSDDFRTESSVQIPWHLIRGLRNRIVHNYGHVDKDVIWNSAIDDITKLKAFCESKLDDSKQKSC